MPVKALHLMKTSIGGGWAFRQMRELVKLGVEVHVLLPPGGPMVGRYAKAGIIEHLLQTDFPIRAPWRFPQLKKRFSEFVGALQPDIIHSHFVGTTLTMRMALGKKHPIPRIFQVPGPLHLEHSIFRKAEIATSGEMDRWIGSCRWTQERYVRSGIDRKRLFISYYGTDIPKFTVHRRGKLRSELGLNDQIKVVGMVAFMYAPKWYLGQTRGLKGHEDLIDAVAICQRNFPDMVCIMAGGAWDKARSYERRVRAYAKKKCGDNIIFLGTRNDVPELYPDFDVVVHPSLSENVGGAAESLLSAIPTITTHVGGFPDVVRNGETGWLVPSSNPPELAKAIIEALQDPANARKKAAQGRVLALSLFDVAESAQQILDIYRKIISTAESETKASA